MGTSFGGNYLLRHLIRNEVRHNIKGLVTLAAPIDVSRVVKDMGMIYQRFFVKRYIEETVLKHPLMKYWEDSSLVDFNHLKKSTNLSEFHGRLTVKLLGYDNVDDLYNAYTITPE